MCGDKIVSAHRAVCHVDDASCSEVKVDTKHRIEIIFDPDTYDEGVVINGVKWATRNVGAPGNFAATIEDFGMYYQWGRKLGWQLVEGVPVSGGLACPHEGRIGETACGSIV